MHYFSSKSTIIAINCLLEEFKYPGQTFIGFIVASAPRTYSRMILTIARSRLRSVVIALRGGEEYSECILSCSYKSGASSLLFLLARRTQGIYGGVKECSSC